MALKDFLLPTENVAFTTQEEVEFADKKYQVIITDKRLILYSKRGLLIKSDDIISKSLDSISGIKYRESGLVFRSASISVWSDSKMDITGPPAHMKPLFQVLQSATTKN